MRSGWPRPRGYSESHGSFGWVSTCSFVSSVPVSFWTSRSSSVITALVLRTWNRMKSAYRTKMMPNVEKRCCCPERPRYSSTPPQQRRTSERTVRIRALAIIFWPWLTNACRTISFFGFISSHPTSAITGTDEAPRNRHRGIALLEILSKFPRCKSNPGTRYKNIAEVYLNSSLSSAAGVCCFIHSYNILHRAYRLNIVTRSENITTISSENS